MDDENVLLTERTWKEFQNAGLLWWVNRILHLFGWVIVLQVDAGGKITEVYPARTRFRGFEIASEAEGFQALTRYIAENANELLQEMLEE